MNDSGITYEQAQGMTLAEVDAAAEQLRATGPEAKAELLRKYAEREPKRFIQYDGFSPPTWPVGPGSEDEDGHELWQAETFELMHGSQVRVLVDPMTSKGDAVAMLRKIADLVDQDGIEPSAEADIPS